MRIFSKKALREFWIKHPDAEQPLKAWYTETVKAIWENPHHIKRYYASASIVHENKVT